MSGRCPGSNQTTLPLITVLEGVCPECEQKVTVAEGRIVEH